jgi:hypothetical protein
LHNEQCPVARPIVKPSRLRTCAAALACATVFVSSAIPSARDDTKSRELLTGAFRQVCLDTGLDRDRVMAAWATGSITSEPLSERLGGKPRTDAEAYFYYSSFIKDGVHLTVSGSRPADSGTLDYCGVHAVFMDIPGAIDSIETRLALAGRHTVEETEYLGMGLEPSVQRTIGWRLPGAKPLAIEAAVEYPLARPSGGLLLSVKAGTGS